jgi:signal transduction histidine kinase/CheY-like chemotaxis protein
VPEILRTKVAVFVELYRKAERIRLLERAAGERRLIDERQGWELERLRGEASRRDEFLAMLAHELRNPLAPVLTGLNLLGRDDTDEHARKQVREMVGRQLRHLTRLVDDLVDVARLIRGRVTLRPERLDLTRLVRTVVGDRRSTMEKSGLALQLEVPENPVWLDGDPSRLTQVLDNLLDNAARFTEPGGRVMVRLGTDADGRQAILSVRDTGAGIDPALLGRLFDAFAQAEEGPDRSRGGLGLGLTVVKGLVELHGGTVEAKSGGPGCGAEFTVRLQAGAAAPAATEKSEINGAVAGSSQLRVLIVEDNRDGADILRTLLELQGYHARVAYSGPEGIETATTWQPDIVLCDLGLPGIDGYGVARNLRHNSATAKTRLVAVSGYGAAEDRRRSREAGFDVHLLKPVDSDELLRVLAAPVSNRETA